MTRYGGIIDGKRGAYGVVIPDLPGCTAMGKTIDEALANAAFAATAWAEVARADGHPIPEPRPLEVLRDDPEIKAALAVGGALAIVPTVPSYRIEDLVEGMTDAEITAAAKSDPDNPPITAAEFVTLKKVGRDLGKIKGMTALIEEESAALGPISDAEAAAMFRAVVRLFKRWGVTDEQGAILLGMPPNTSIKELRKRYEEQPVIYRGIKIEPPPGERSAVARTIRDDLLRHPPGKRSRGRRGPRDLRARLSHLMGIRKALRIIFRAAPRGYAWIKAPNDAFAGRSALDVMLGGKLSDLASVRRYLDAEAQNHRVRLEYGVYT